MEGQRYSATQAALARLIVSGCYRLISSLISCPRYSGLSIVRWLGFGNLSQKTSTLIPSSFLGKGFNDNVMLEAKEIYEVRPPTYC